MNDTVRRAIPIVLLSVLAAGASGPCTCMPGGGAEPGSVGATSLKESPDVAAEIGTPTTITLLDPTDVFTAKSADGLLGVHTYSLTGPHGSGKAHVWLQKPWAAIGIRAHLNGHLVSSGNQPPIPGFDPDSGLD